MKRFKHLSDKFKDREFIRQSILDAARHKKKRKIVRKVLANLNQYTDDLQHQLLDNTFKPSPTREMVIFDHCSNKERTINPPRFYPDQCVHWAIINAIKPALMRGMYVHSVGNVPGRGQAAGVQYVKKVLRKYPKKTKYCLYFDVHHYYASIDHDNLMGMLARVIDDGLMLSLVKKVVDSYPDGLPLGNYTSQWLANFYLQGFDHFIKEKCYAPHYCRYVDDCVIIGANKKRLHRTRAQVEKYLQSIGLELKPNWQVFPIDKRGIDFLGYRFFHGYTKQRHRNFKRFRRQSIRVHDKLIDQRPVSAHTAQGYLSRVGNLKWQDSFLISHRYVYRHDLKILKHIIREEAKNDRVHNCDTLRREQFAPD